MGGVKYKFSESSFQGLFKNQCLVNVAVRVIEIFGTEDNCSATYRTKQGVGENECFLSAYGGLL